MKNNSADLAMKTIAPGMIVLARVAIMGARRGTGWRFVWYEAKEKTKSGYIFAGVQSDGMYPNQTNKKYSDNIENEAVKNNIHVVIGRPLAGLNAPLVSSIEIIKCKISSVEKIKCPTI